MPQEVDSLTHEQLRRYADDLAKVYQEEKRKTRQLEILNDKLSEEIEARKQAEEEVSFLLNLIIEIQEEERSRIAQELHDDLGQSLFGLKLKLQSLIDQDESKHADVMGYINGIMGKTREISHNLSPISLKKIGLTQAIYGLADTFNDDPDLQVDVDLQNIDDFFEENWDTNLYRIVQESLVNVMKHSKATRAVVEGKIDDKQLYLSISDNGQGLSQSGSGLSGIGMLLMKKRASILGGSIAFSSVAGEGTEVKIELSK